jgi:hypothetical protein
VQAEVQSVRTTNTHFEQVSLAAVKKMLEREQAISEKSPDTQAENLTVEKPSNKTEPYSVHRTS